MKKFLSFFSLLMLCTVAVNAQSWVFGEEKWHGGFDDDGKVISKDYTETTTIDGLTIIATSDKKLTVDSSNKTVDGVKYVGRLKFGGKGSATERNVNFDVTGPCTVSVVVAHASSSGDARPLVMCAGALDLKNPDFSQDIEVGDPVKVTFDYKGEATKLYLASGNSGLNLYAIYVEYPPTYTVCGAFNDEASFFGEAWNPARTENDMVKGEDGIYTKTFEGVDLPTGQIQYKVVKNHSWDNGDWGFNGNNADYNVNEAGKYNITFYFNPDAPLDNGFNVHCVLEAVVEVQPVPENISIDMTNGVQWGDEGGAVVKTFACKYPLDFTNVEGIKAYVATKNLDTYGTLASVVLTPLDVVPANTGVVLKAEEAKAYTVAVPTEVEPAEFQNVLLVAETDIDLYEAITTDYGDFSYGPAELARGTVVTGYDMTTYQPTYGVDTGFFPYPVAYSAGESFITAGTAYLPIANGEWDPWGAGYVKLQFSDAAVAQFENIGALLASPLTTYEGVPATLNLNYTGQVMWTDNKYMLVEDYTGGLTIQIPEGLTVKTGDIISGSYTGNFVNILYPQLLCSALTDANTLMVLDNFDVAAKEVNSLPEAFENTMKLVKVKNLGLKIDKGSYSNDYYFTYTEGTDETQIYVNDAYYLVSDQLGKLTEDDVIEEALGFAFIIPEESPYILYGYSQAEFVPLAIKVKDRYFLLGDFCGGWNVENEIEMIQSEENPNEYKLVMEDFEAEGKKYEYKMRCGHDWTGYQLPSEGNYNFVFGTEGFPAGTYTLTFVANTENHTLTLDVQSVADGINQVDMAGEKATIYNLQGVRVAAPQKGLYIKNGKKMMVK